MSFLTIQPSTACVGAVNFLPASKSYSNRVLIVDALAGGGSVIHNLSEANDTVLMKRLLASADPVLDAEDAGTTFRFLTAFLALRPGTTTLTGTERMKQRPVGLLTDALTTLGAEIRHLEKQGYPPLEITGISKQKTNKVSIRGDVSSQYISALMMIAPVLPKGIEITFIGKVGSQPYLELTAAIMQMFGAECKMSETGITIKHLAYHPAEVTVEPDWSAAGYWYAFTALAGQAEVLLPGLSLKSLQGDRVTADIMEKLGVNSEQTEAGIKLTKTDHKEEVEWDFVHCPDIAQTIAVVCAAKGIRGRFTGMESLRIKETDRIQALQHELAKLGARLEEADGVWTLIPSEKLPEEISVRTYKDHRMAMAFAPLATLMKVSIENPDVVRKSYPRFWEDVRAFGFKIAQGSMFKD